MLALVKKWFGPKANPIGVDFGSDSLKLAQVARIGGEWQLIAAASADIPAHVRQDAAARMNYLAGTTRDLLAQGGFSGRNAVLALPAASTFFQHLRVPKMDDETLKKTLPWEARGKLPIDPVHALLRHHIAGTIYQDQEEKLEVIAMAAGRDVVNQYINVAAKAKLEIVNMNVEPCAIVDCFSHIYRRKVDASTTSCYVDIGSAGTRAVIARGSHIMFARSISIGGDHLTRAVAAALNLKFEEAKLLRLRLSALQPSVSEAQQKSQVVPAAQEQAAEQFAVLTTALAAAKAEAAPETERRTDPAGFGKGSADGAGPNLSEPHHQAAAAEQACREPLSKIVEELDLCRRYYESTFSNHPVDRLVFVGGEAKHRNLCQYIARELSLAAQVGDPLVRMGRCCEISLDSGIDRRQPQPNWAVAIGLSLGPIDEASSKAGAT